MGVASIFHAPPLLMPPAGEPQAKSPLQGDGLLLQK